MPELGGFQQIAPHLTHPLVLAGFGLLLFFGLLRAVLRSGVMPTVSRTVGGRALLLLLRYGFALALVTMVFGFALAFFQSEREAVDVDQLIRDFAAARERAAGHRSTLNAVVRLAEIEDGNAFRDAVVALVTQANQADAPQGIERAIELLRQGETAAAEGVFAEILDQRRQDRAAASQEAAEAARHLGAIAYFDNTAKAIEAYLTATELDADDTWSWILLGRSHVRAGSLADAEQAFEQARLAAERAGNDRDVGAAYHELGRVREVKGNLAGAWEAYDRFHRASAQLVAKDPSDHQWRRDLSVSYERIGDVQRAQGDLEAALEAYQQSLAVAEELAERNSNISGWQRDVFACLIRIGDVQSARGNLDAALQTYRDSHAIAEQLTEENPRGPEEQYILGISHERIGDVLSASDQLLDAFAAYQRKQQIISSLAQSDPSNTVWQRDLSVSFIKIGDVHLARGDLEKALAAYEDAFVIREKLAARDPSNTEWHQDLSLSYIKIGNVHSARGNLVGALEAYEESLAIRDRLAAQDPSNAEWQRDLIVSNVKLAQVAEQQDGKAARKPGNGIGRHWTSRWHFGTAAA